MTSEKPSNYYGSIVIYIFLLITIIASIYLLISPESLLAGGVAFVLITSLYIIWIEKKREKEIKHNRRKREYQKRVDRYQERHKKRNIKREFKDYGKVVQFKDKDNED